ncbi:hypothetical protein [Flavobacterium sp. 102]|uniref:hypothetical protein n=1 Tax=Flavobacterium sp. 102 TaxID=2135623 RepID=UPI000EB3CFF5|nr:hypothetical protein [Flavobacterium sp. 102]RKS01445.1 hypothetical protein C8C84_1105 [Flavobacterium sp. 102]
MRILSFLYYALYKLSTVIKRKEDIDHIIACNILSVMLSTNTILFFAIVLRFSFAKGFFLPYDNYIKIFFGSIFFIWYFILKRHFIEKEYYVWIIGKYDTEYKDRIKLIRIIGFLYLIFTPISFIVFAIFISRM